MFYKTPEHVHFEGFWRCDVNNNQKTVLPRDFVDLD